MLLSVNAQVVDSKMKLFLGYGVGNYLGDQLFNDQGTIAPSFYRNLENVNAINVGISYKLLSNYSVVFSVDNQRYSSWLSDIHTSYTNSSIKAIHFCPAIQYHTAYTERGLFNQLKLYGHLSPVFSFSTINYPIRPTDFDAGVEFRELNYGVRATLGAEYALTNKIGVFANASIQQSFVNSQLYIDTRYLLTKVNIGLALTISWPKSFNL